MKKVLLILFIVFVLIILSIFYYPKRISLGGGLPMPLLPGEVRHYQECDGFYLETYNDNYRDGDRGGWCFGDVEQY